MMKRTFLFIILCCFISTLCLGQSKVYWIHGYGDDSSFWNDYRYLITPSYARGDIIEWYPNNSIETIAKEIDKNKIASQSSRAILVGHSAGGLVARQIQKNDSKVKAVITAGTPNNGAGIVNAVYLNTYYNVFENALDKANNTVNYTLLAAINCAPPVTWLIAPLTAPLTVAFPKIEKVCLTPLADSLECYLNRVYRKDATFMDMRPNSTFVKSLNSSSPSVPILSIYGAEDTWPLLRLLATNNGEASETEYFSYIYQADNLINEVCSIHDSVYDALKWPAIIMPWIWATRELIPSSKSKWEDVGTYINYDIHNEYSKMIRAYHFETREYTTGWWIFRRTYTETVMVYDDHDGMITANDAILDKPNVTNVKVEGVNHMEMGSNDKMYNVLRDALRYGNYDPAFKYSNY